MIFGGTKYLLKNAPRRNAGRPNITRPAAIAIGTRIPRYMNTGNITAPMISMPTYYLFGCCFFSSNNLKSIIQASLSSLSAKPGISPGVGRCHSLQKSAVRSTMNYALTHSVPTHFMSSPLPTRLALQVFSASHLQTFLPIRATVSCTVRLPRHL